MLFPVLLLRSPPNRPPTDPSPFLPLAPQPQRAILYIKNHFPRHAYETTFLSLWTYSWRPQDPIDVSQPANLRTLLSDPSVGNHYSPSEIDDILNATKAKEYKDLLVAETKKCVEEYGAFGAPWFWMTRDGLDGKGSLSEPSFGSDRFGYMYRFLGVPYREGEIVGGEEEKGGVKKAVAKL